MSSVLVGCDGERPLGKLIEASPIPDGLDRAGFHSLCLETVRELIALGFLVSDALGTSQAEGATLALQ